MLASTLENRRARAAPTAPGQTGTIALLIDPAQARRWHGWLIEQLNALPGARVLVQPASDGAPLPAAAEALLQLEQTLYGGAPGLARIPLQELAAPLHPQAAQDARIVIDLAGSALPPRGAHRLLPLFDGAAGTGALLDALLDQRLPQLAILHNGQMQPLGLAAVEDFSVLSRAADFILAQVAAGLARAAQRLLAMPAALAPLPELPLRQPHPLRLARHLLIQLAQKAVRRIANHGRWPRWRCGWRRLASMQQGLRQRWQAPDMGQYTWLADDGRRFFADPFAIERNGLVHVFAEELPHATGRGLICHFTIDAKGRASAPRPVLEADVHLSYPFLFAHEGTLYMIPESEEAREVRLYRCIAFPHRWQLETVLIARRALSDATIHHDGRRFWLFASERLAHGSSWDTLAVFTAERLQGPWREVAAPALIDAGAARPAGQLWRHNGHLLRAAQDCRGAYGAGLAICHITQLDDDGFAQQVLARIRPPAPWRGLHTLNVAGAFELIDAVN